MFLAYRKIKARQQQIQYEQEGVTYQTVSDKDTALTELRELDGAVIVVIGTRGTGKSELTFRIAEFLGKPTYAISPEQEPGHGITRVNFNDFEEVIPPHSTVIFDDMPVYGSANDYHEDMIQTLNRIIPMVRHDKKWHLIFSTQTAASADRYILDCNCCFLKPLGLLAADLERPNIRKIYKEYVNPIFDGKPTEWVKNHAYFMAPTFRGVIEFKMVK